MALENLKSAFSNIVPIDQSDVTAFNSGKDNIQPFPQSNVITFNSGKDNIQPFPQSNVITFNSVFSDIILPDYDTNTGGIHGGLSSESPSQPPHSETHSSFDNFQHRPGFGPGIWNDEQVGPSAFENMTAEVYSPIFNSLYGSAGINLSQHGGRHGGLSSETPSQPPHSEAHSLFDNFQHRPGFGPGLWNDEQAGPSAFENMIAEEYSPILNLATGAGSFGEGIQLGGAPASLYPSVAVASIQQSFTVNSPYGFNAQVTGQIAFTRTPRIDENTLPVDFLTKGYSYTGMGNYSLSEPNEIAGFTKNFNSYGYSVDETPLGSTKFLNDDGIVIASGLAPKTYSTAEDVNSTTYGIVQARIVDFLTGNYSYSGASNYGTGGGVPNTISGFTANFNTGGYTEADTALGISKFLNDDGIAIVSGLAPKSKANAEDVDSSGYTGVQTLTDMFTSNFNPTFPGGWSEETPYGASEFVSADSEKSGIVTMRSNHGLTSLNVSTAPDVFGLFSNDGGITKSYDTYGTVAEGETVAAGYDWRTAHGTPTSPYQGQILNINPYQGSIFDDLISMRSNYGVTSLNLDTAPGVLGLFSNDGSSRSYDTYGDSPKGYDWRTAHGTPTTPYQGQILNINPYQGSILDTKGDVEFDNVTEVDVTERYSSGTIKTQVTNFLTSTYTADGEEITISGFDANFTESKLVADITSTTITSRYLDSAKEVPEGGGTGINLQASSWWTGGDTAVKALVTPSKFTYTTQGIEIGTGLTQAVNTRTISIDTDKLAATTLYDTGGWSALYNKDHTAKVDVGYHYPNVSRDSLDLRYQGSGVSSHHTLRSLWWKEPYVITDIEDRQIGITGRSIPIERALTDVGRLTKYLTSPHGLMFFGKQNLLGLFVREPSGTLLARPQRYNTFYTPLSTLANAGAHLLGEGWPNLMLRRDAGIRLLTNSNPLINTGLHDRYTAYLESKWYAEEKKEEDYSEDSGVSSVRNVNVSVTGTVTTPAASYKNLWGLLAKDEFTSGDPYTVREISKTPLDSDMTSENKGMPLYFKDLRDNNYIIFRGFIEGLSENISPSWTEENYIGRSEPVFIYEKATRDISFTLKLFAQTKGELAPIYQKLNRLTSLCYPEYQKDENLNSKVRMKPPLVKFRLGELFGSENNEMLGFIKSLSYTYDDGSPWETKQGKRVPKYILASITFQVIHMEVPSLDFARTKRFGDTSGENNKYQFYGINAVEGVGVGAE